VAAHLFLVAGLLLAYRGFVAPDRLEAPAIVAIAISGPPGEAAPAPPRGRPRRELEAPVEIPASVPTAAAAAAPEPAPPPPEPAGTPSGVFGGTPGGRGLAMRPGRGDPRLWAYPVVIPEGEGRLIDMDSLTRRRMEAMANIMDSVARHGGDSLAPYRPPYRTPSWTFDSNGRTYGIDQQWIHLGIFKIPTAALALIPVPVQGNYQQERVYAQQMQMRADILRAAARSEAEEDFHRAVAQIRERKDRERTEQRRRDEQQRARDRDRPIP